jgi:hypothetical protein
LVEDEPDAVRILAKGLRRQKYAADGVAIEFEHGNNFPQMESSGFPLSETFDWWLLHKEAQK